LPVSTRQRFVEPVKPPDRRNSSSIPQLCHARRDNRCVKLYRDEGVVLRTQKLGEADRIVTLLTRRHGRVRAVAKGVRRTGSKFGARLEPFSQVDCQFYAGRELDIVTQTETITAYGGTIVGDYPGYTSATAILETAERLTAAEREPALRLYLLVVGALRAIAERRHDPGLVLDSFVLRALAVAGWAPALDACARCGAEGPHRWFSPAAGGSVCADCRIAGAATVSAETVRLLTALAAGDWEPAEASEPRDRRTASGVVAAYLQWHLERGLRSLPLVERT
jgi:DNA repair protein RecO (recombination protein O)